MQASTKAAVLWISLSIPIAVLTIGTQSPAAEGKEIRLQWAFGALTGPEENPRLVSIEEHAVLSSGDRMKIFLQPQIDCFVYLFYRSSQKELMVLLPARGIGSRATAGARTMVPTGSDWFRLDEVTGIETFYLLVSARPLAKLEALCSKLVTAAAQPEREAIDRQILSEVTRLQKKRRTLTADAERPIRLGGNFRGAVDNAQPELPDISRIAMEITASDFYSRTFTIDHR